MPLKYQNTIACMAIINKVSKFIYKQIPFVLIDIFTSWIFEHQGEDPLMPSL